jgi:hypothetical protein
MQIVTLTRYSREDTPRRVLATRCVRKNHTAPSGDYRDQRRPATTKEKLLSTNTQPRLIKHNSTGDPPTSAIPTGQSLGIFLFAPTTTKPKTKQRKKNINLTGSNSGRDQSSTNLRLEEQN